jgi:hypothetical protein
MVKYVTEKNTHNGKALFCKPGKWRYFENDEKSGRNDR